MAANFDCPLEVLKEYEDMQEAIRQKRGPLLVSGCVDSQKVQLACRLAEGSPLSLIVTYNDSRAKEICEDARCFADPVQMCIRDSSLSVFCAAQCLQPVVEGLFPKGVPRGRECPDKMANQVVGVLPGQGFQVEGRFRIVPYFHNPAGGLQLLPVKGDFRVPEAGEMQPVNICLLYTSTRLWQRLLMRHLQS